MQPRARLLVIDDDPQFRSLIVSLLRRDYLVSVASEGCEGFRKALEHPPDVAVVDIQMPGWGGLKTLRAFRTHPMLHGVKVVMLTSDASKETVLAAIHGGAADYVIKSSFSRADFFRKLDRILTGGTAGTVAAISATGRFETFAAAESTRPGDLAEFEDDEIPQEILDGWE